MRASPTRLRRCDPSGPGFARRRWGRGFRYLDDRGRSLDDPDHLDRIAKLVIPPAWSDVWISPWPNGHIQCVGVDAAGRRQYIYHERWRTSRDRRKFERMIEFARALERVRTVTAAHLRAEGMTRERVLACTVRLLDRGFFRIGGEDYAGKNGSFGLATLRKSHVRLAPGSRLVFEYPAKGGKLRHQSVVDADVYRVVAALKARRGGNPELFCYKEDRRWVDVKSADINAYLKEISGGDYTAKDFRTWHATVLAGVGLAVSTEALLSKTSRTRAVTRVVKEVAHYLGNTPAVCRRSYIDPTVIERFHRGQTVAKVLADLGSAELFGDELGFQALIEVAVLDLLEEKQAAAA